MGRDLADTLWFAGWLAALLVLFWLGTRLPLQSRPPRLRALALAWGTVLTALGVTFLANLALSRHDAHFDLTRERGFTPSPEAEAVVRSLTHEVRLTYFYQAQDEAGRRARHLVEMLGQVPGDRKSTRLNSSHLVISYAVFCLKKKKKRATQWPGAIATQRSTQRR